MCKGHALFAELHMDLLFIFIDQIDSYFFQLLTNISNVDIICHLKFSLMLNDKMNEHCKSIIPPLLCLLWKASPWLLVTECMYSMCLRCPTDDTSHVCSLSLIGSSRSWWRPMTRASACTTCGTYPCPWSTRATSTAAARSRPASG